MTKCENKRNVLQHDGTNQLSRALDQLVPDYIRVNEKTLEQWTTFTSILAENLKFYNADNFYTGNWSKLFSVHTSVNYARLSTQDVDAIKAFFKSNLDVLKGRFIFIAGVEQNNLIANQRAAFSSIFEGIFTTSLFIDAQFTSTTSDVYRARLGDLIKTKLRPALAKLLAYYKAGANDFIVPSGNATQVFWGYNLASLNAFLGALKSSEWFDYPNGVNTPMDYYNSLIGDISIYTPDTLTVANNHDIYNALNRASRHNLYTSVIDTFAYASGFVRQFCENAFEQEIVENGLTPHLALYFTFLHVLQEAQKNINLFTERHLDFFYKQVLRLGPNSAQPNYAHLCLEIGRQIPETLLPKGVLFKAGKDSTGKEVFYSLAQDTTFNHTKVAAIKNFYQAGPKDNADKIFNQSKAFASPVTNSVDGMGKEIKDDPASWHPFGNKQGKSGTTLTMLMPSAELGFALASPYLLLREGDRTIQVTLRTPHFALLNLLSFKCEVTTVKGWQTIEGGVAARKSTIPFDNSIIFKIQLPATFPGVEGYDEAVHAAAIDTTFPVIRFILDDDDFSKLGKFEKVRFTQFAGCRIDVAVGSWASNAASVNPSTFNGLKSLYLSNHTGELDAKKPFYPFGKPARLNNYLTIGSQELFVKPGAKYQIAVEHGDFPKNRDDIYYFTKPLDFNQQKIDFMISLLESHPKVNYEYLNKGVWHTKQVSQLYDFETYSLLTTDTEIEKDATTKYGSAYDVFAANTSGGYVKFNLIQDFGEEEYQSDLIDFRIKQSRRVVDLKEPKQPYAPCIKKVCINYKASVEIDFSKVSDASNYVSYFHVHPYGAKKLTNAIQPRQALLQGLKFNLQKLSVYQPLLIKTGKLVRVPLSFGQVFGIQKPIFPQFDGPNAQGTVQQFISELYIGLNNSRPLQRLNLLFQVLDGSTDPLVVKPDKHIYWFYLSENEWKLFPNNKIKDYTDQLLQSGIITYEIPEDANTDNTLLPKGSVWLKAAIKESPEAVSRLIDIQAQAALVQFADNGNSSTFLQNQLPAGSITKLAQPLAAIKKVVQPFGTFGGKCVEPSSDFRVRVSERLRHKDRAIQIYDYERLILQQFPVLQKVKCLNHTRYEPGLIYNEQAPGHVTIVTIPYVKFNNCSDPRKPYTSTRDLSAVKNYISKKISPHIKVHVQNPVFEEVKLQFKLRFIQGLDRNFYTNQLREDLTRFLSPWAYDDSAQISFGGRIYKSKIINFIEDLQYVDVLADVKMYMRKNNATQFSNDTDTVIGSTGSSILVSVSPEQHSIDLM